VTLNEHQAIFDGFVAGDGKKAAAAMRAHIDSVMAELITFATEHAELFADGELLKNDPNYARFPFG
jgi:DNA-binding GntR family transcriptional regulator